MQKITRKQHKHSKVVYLWKNKVVYDDIIETTEVVDLGVEMDIAVERSKWEHEVQPDIFEVSMKKKKVEHTPAISTESISPWQIESVVEVPYIDWSSDVPQIHTFGSVQTERDLNVDKVETVQVKKEVVDTDSDDVIVTFVEEGFPKEVKKEPHSSSRSRQSMKLISTDSCHKEYQHRIDILAEVHRPQETRAQQSILDHDYLPPECSWSWITTSCFWREN